MGKGTHFPVGPLLSPTAGVRLAPKGPGPIRRNSQHVSPTGSTGGCLWDVQSQAVWICSCAGLWESQEGGERMEDAECMQAFEVLPAEACSFLKLS